MIMMMIRHALQCLCEDSSIKKTHLQTAQTDSTNYNLFLHHFINSTKKKLSPFRKELLLHVSRKISLEE
jgi:hypothetical protein